MLSELDYVKEQLSRRTRAEWIEIAEQTGVPFSTLKKLAYGQTANPTSNTTGPLAAYFRTPRTPKKRQREPRQAA